MTIAEVKQEKVKLQNKIGDLLKEFNRKNRYGSNGFISKYGILHNRNSRKLRYRSSR